MIQEIKNAIKLMFKRFDIAITRYSTYEELQSTLQELQRSSSSQDIEVLLRLPEETALQRLKYLKKSKSQLRQDLFALSHLNFKSNGFFVEFGATNGVDLSNTYLMEKEFGWQGILAEPAKCWHSDLKSNRNCSIETDCVWSDSTSQLTFNEVEIAELSTINSYSDKDSHKKSREAGKTYDVRTISFNDLLIKYNAPKDIDYLSIDTEGSEFEILSNFDFSKHNFQVITCEHNFTPMREKIFELLVREGYARVFEDLSMFDDWYIRAYP